MNEEQRTSIITHKYSREVGNTSDGTVINPVSNKNLGHARQAKEAAEKRCVDHVGYMHRVDMPCFTTLKCTPVARTLHEGSAECVPHMGGTCVSCAECITLLFSHLERQPGPPPLPCASYALHILLANNPPAAWDLSFWRYYSQAFKPLREHREASQARVVVQVPGRSVSCKEACHVRTRIK